MNLEGEQNTINPKNTDNEQGESNDWVWGDKKPGYEPNPQPEGIDLGSHKSIVDLGVAALKRLIEIKKGKKNS